MTDVDGDGDIDVLYARQGAIYLKRHQGNQVLRRHIQDRIRIYTLADVFEKFLRVEDLEGFEVTRYTRFLQSSGFPPERLSASYLSDDRRSHMRFVLDTDLFGQMKKRGNQKTRVTYDVMDRE